MLLKYTESFQDHYLRPKTIKPFKNHLSFLPKYQPLFVMAPCTYSTRVFELKYRENILSQNEQLNVLFWPFIFRVLKKNRINYKYKLHSTISNTLLLLFYIRLAAARPSEHDRLVAAADYDFVDVIAVSSWRAVITMEKTSLSAFSE